MFLQAKAQAQHLKQALAKYFGPSETVPEEQEENGVWVCSYWSLTFDPPFLMLVPPTLSESLRKCPYCKQYNLVIKKRKDGM